MNRRRFLTRTAMLASGATAPLIAGCGGGGGSVDTPTETPTPTATETPTATPESYETPKGADVGIAIQDLNFKPSIVSVEPGTTIGWRNIDDIPHTVSSSLPFDSATSWDPLLKETLTTGQDTTYTFDSEGIYHYRCTIHTGECGAVLVGRDSLPVGLPCKGAEQEETPTPTP